MHADGSRGPNRVAYDPEIAHEYMKKLEQEKWPDPLLRATHMPTGMSTCVESLSDFEQLLELVNRVGNDKRTKNERPR